MPAHPVPDSTLREAMDAVKKYGNVCAAARAMNIPRPTLQGRIETAKARGIGSTEEQLETLHGNNPDHDLTHTVPAPMILRGTSSLYGDDGSLKLQWVKTKLDDAKVEEAIRAAISALAESVPRAKPAKRPTHVVEALCNLYTLTDCHVGMYAWAAETGSDWDLEIAEKTLKGAIDYLVEASPPAKTGILLNLGDFLHYDSLSAVTPTNKNPLDADSRYSKMVKVAIRVLRYAVDATLRRHEKVVVIMSEGNHDQASSVWLRHLFGLLYENEPRVEVLDSEMVYTIYQHGKTMLAFHHGHLSKKEALPLLFAAQYPKEWGTSTHRYCHTGHQHHFDEKEHSGMKVRQHATMAARDAYAARGGWIAERQIDAVTYHAEYGQVATVTVTPEMLE